MSSCWQMHCRACMLDKTALHAYLAQSAHDVAQLLLPLRQLTWDDIIGCLVRQQPCLTALQEITCAKPASDW